jgi:hypothetical protein
MFDLAGGQPIIGTRRSHAPLGFLFKRSAGSKTFYVFGSNAVQEAKLFMFLVQT